MRLPERYARQVLFRGLGEAGQERLGRASVMVAGCGALGTHAAELLARAGVGRIRIVDRDFVEPSNLHRQSLFTEADARDSLPKAVAAESRLREVNSEIAVEGIPEQIDADSIGRLAVGVDLVVDGTDNFETRFLLNDQALRSGRPWIFAACVGGYGLTMNILPGETPCLRCLLSVVPAPGEVDTCDTAGILPPVPALFAALEASEALKILSGNEASASRDLFAADLWGNVMQRVRLDRAEVSRDCPACARGLYEYLEGGKGTRTVTLCGRNAVQVQVRRGAPADLDRLTEALARSGPVVRNRFLVRASIEGLVVAVFADGRAIISGTDDQVRARAIYDRYVGG